eukprot:GHRR01005578.1.p2 GENE.GHRR01005578.1~~GHRR01005578.1.p2  ORF type:complete len:103 (-),score=23.18 GHRR01005578.1:513-821(-)
MNSTVALPLPPRRIESLSHILHSRPTAPCQCNTAPKTTSQLQPHAAANFILTAITSTINLLLLQLVGLLRRHFCTDTPALSCCPWCNFGGCSCSCCTSGSIA